MLSSLLAEWGNFYVILGGSAAGLTGLTFVVITLTADLRPAQTIGVRTFLTPTIVHFAAVLAIAAFLTVPHHTLVTLSTGFTLLGVGGLAYAAFTAINLRHISGHYSPVREDWICNVILPGIVYSIILAMAIHVWYREEQSLYGIAGAALFLLFIGIRNAWDVAVWNTLHKGGK